jgi:hypothetical protein
MHKQTICITVIIGVASLFIASQGAIAQQQSSGGLKIVSSNGFKDNNEFSPSYHIVGEVQNNGSDKAEFVQVSATLYDSSNQVIGTESTYTNPSTIDPGAKAPFEILVSTDKVKGGDLNIINHFSTQPSS